jgi:hypothetical protein
VDQLTAPVFFATGKLAGPGFYSGCQNNVPIVGRYFVTTIYAAILLFGTLL